MQECRNVGLLQSAKLQSSVSCQKSLQGLFSEGMVFGALENFKLRMFGTWDQLQNFDTLEHRKILNFGAVTFRNLQVFEMLVFLVERKRPNCQRSKTPKFQSSKIIELQFPKIKSSKMACYNPKFHSPKLAQSSKGRRSAFFLPGSSVPPSPLMNLIRRCLALGRLLRLAPQLMRMMQPESACSPSGLRLLQI